MRFLNSFVNKWNWASDYMTDLWRNQREKVIKNGVTMEQKGDEKYWGIIHNSLGAFLRIFTILLAGKCNSRHFLSFSRLNFLSFWFNYNTHSCKIQRKLERKNHLSNFSSFKIFPTPPLTQEKEEEVFKREVKAKMEMTEMIN